MMYSGPTTTLPGPGATDPATDSSLQESISGRPGLPSVAVTCGLLAGGWAGGTAAGRGARGVPLAVQLARMAQVSVAKVIVRNNG
jgi:hypothetical protein